MTYPTPTPGPTPTRRWYSTTPRRVLSIAVVVTVLAGTVTGSLMLWIHDQHAVPVPVVCETSTTGPWTVLSCQGASS